MKAPRGLNDNSRYIGAFQSKAELPPPESFPYCVAHVLDVGQVRSNGASWLDHAAEHAAMGGELTSFTDLALASRALPQLKDAGTPPTKLFDFATEMASGGSTNQIARATDEKKWKASSTLKITPSANSNCYLVKTYSGAAKDWTGVTSFGLALWSDRDLPSNATITFYYGNDTTWNNYKNFSMPLGTAGTRDGKQYIKVLADQALTNYGPFSGTGSNKGTQWNTVGTGGLLNNDIEFIRFDFANLSGIPIWLDGLYANGSTRPAIVLWFDNWWDQYGGATYANHHQYIKPILDRYGWKCGITVPLNEYGTGQNTSIAAMQQMHDEGHDIILNDVSNPGFTTSGRSLAQINADIATTRATLAGYGWYRGNKIWCLNQNETSKDLRALLSANGVELARAGGAERRFVQLELGAEDPLNFGSNSMDKVTSSDCQELMTRTINYGAVSHMYWHLFRTGGTANGAAPSESLTSWVEAFADFAAALRTQELAGNIDVLSPTQYNIRRKAFGSLV